MIVADENLETPHYEIQRLRDNELAMRLGQLPRITEPTAPVIFPQLNRLPGEQPRSQSARPAAPVKARTN